MLMTRSFEEINASDAVVVELSGKGVGIGIEAGYAYAVGKPIMTIARRGSDISETLCGISDKVLLFQEMETVTALFTEQ